jgi:hypothetical protein
MDLDDSLAQDFIILEEISVGIAACQLQILHWQVTIPRVIGNQSLERPKTLEARRLRR